MSFATRTTTNKNTSLPQQKQQQIQHHWVSNPEQQQQILNPSNFLNSTMCSISATNCNTTDAIFDPNANADANGVSSPLQLISETQQTQLLVECFMPGIYFTKDFISWKEEQLRAHKFSHIITIDKHIQELYYPNQQPDIFKLCSNTNYNIQNARRDNSSSMDAFDYSCPPTNHLKFGKEFQVIDLNFGEKSYLTRVLPNCYKAVKFINKALQAGGTILVIDCNGGEQKCLTIIVAYLMYNNNISFSTALARLKEFYKKADLDRFYISQLYEYEPILQVQRAQSRGHSCSRNVRAAILKRKKPHGENDATLDNNIADSSSTSYAYCNTGSYNNTTITTELLNNCNPLNRFDSTQMKRQEVQLPNRHNHAITQANRNITHKYNHFLKGTIPAITTGGWYNCDDNAME